MAFKDLLLLIGKGTDGANSYGLWLAEVSGATLTAVSPIESPGLSPFIMLEIPGEIRNDIQKNAESAAQKALGAFLERAKGTGAAVETRMLDAATGNLGDEVSRLARYFDATILQQPSSEGTGTSGLIESLLFGSGHPVVIVPYISITPGLGTVLIAWDGGGPSARAVRDALPLLAMAQRVEIVTVGSETSGKLSAADLARHLARHGIHAEARQITYREVDIASTLLSHAADVHADLLVMGGYGHSRLREIVLGGTTRTILQSMTLPVLMAH